MARYPRLRVPRDRLLTLLIFAALAEIAWTIYLGWRLPRQYVANHWDLAWVGLDTAQVLMLLAAAWAAWRRRALLILFATSAGTLLLLDAWFDVTTARHGDFGQSLLWALIVEVPSALALFWITRRTIQQVVRSTFADVEHAARVRDIPINSQSSQDRSESSPS